MKEPKYPTDPFTIVVAGIVLAVVAGVVYAFLPPLGLLLAAVVSPVLFVGLVAWGVEIGGTRALRANDLHRLFDEESLQRDLD